MSKEHWKSLTLHGEASIFFKEGIFICNNNMEDLDKIIAKEEMYSSIVQINSGLFHYSITRASTRRCYAISFIQNRIVNSTLFSRVHVLCHHHV